MKVRNKYYLFIIIYFLSVTLFAQVESSNILLTRGKLWQTVQFAKSGPAYSDWAKKGFGLDWPGFDQNWVKENIGGPASHMSTGGFYVGCMRDADSVLSVEDWSIYGSSVSEAGTKYKIVEHQKLFNGTENHWLQSNPNVGEEVVESVWEYNINYDDEYQLKRMLPIRVKRRVHQWSGSKSDENYIIHEYTFFNISDEIKSNVTDGRFVADTLKDFYAMLNYGLHSNSRAWNVLFPSYTQGARNTLLRYDAARKLIQGNAFDNPATPDVNESFGKAIFMGPLIRQSDGSLKPTGEYLAPAFVGVKLLYSSPDKSSKESTIREYGWSAGNNTADWHGPFDGIGSDEDRYQVLKNISKVSNYVDKPTHELMTNSRMWSIMTFGPYDIAPSDSIKIVFAEIVNGIPYSQAIDIDNYPVNTVNTLSRNIFRETVDRVQLTFDNNLNHPDPPAAPKFIVDYNREDESVANVLYWKPDMESLADPDDGENDLAGYIIYRSNYLQIGPWNVVDTVFVAEQEYFDGLEYKYVDSSVEVGESYYYALTAFDTGRDSWNINTSVKFSETNSNRVPPLESSIFANRMITTFVATLPPKETMDEVLVVPNPFVIGQGSSRPGEGDQIQFVNIPNPCTIRIYTIRGDIVKTINVSKDVGAIVSWNQITDFGQFVTSGIYIYHIESKFGTKIGKLAIVR